MASSSSASPKRETLLEERLIEAVRRRRPLWDSSTPLHKNVRVLIYCWRDVSLELGITEAATKKKWKSLRDYFFRQVKEKGDNDSKDAANNTEYCMWPYYDLLTFLKANKKDIDHTNYVLTDEDRELLDKISKQERRQRFNISNIPTSQVSRRRSKKEETPVFATNISFGNYSDLDETTNQRCKKLRPLVYAPKPENLLQRSTKERIDKVTLCEPPPLRVFRKIPNILKKRDSLITSIRAAQSKPQPNQTLKPTPKTDFKPSETNNTEFDADLHFFKSLLPFMWALPLKDKLRVRNGIQDLILKELSAIATKDDVVDMGSQPTSSTHEDPLTPDDGNNGPDEETQSNSSMIVKEEFEDADDTMIFEVDSKSLTFEKDGNHYDNVRY